MLIIDTFFSINNYIPAHTSMNMQEMTRAMQNIMNTFASLLTCGVGLAIGGDNSLLGLGLGTGAETVITSLAAVTNMLRPLVTSAGGVVTMRKETIIMSQTILYTPST